ncbi:glycosyltransferase [Acetobacteraceae bacterium KSS8]|uniref:Glycosyltransferase n=1 Tax=Endosaccharibacter trunci TaxID=2812733 RepID=A0ABT1WB05_9PROT|nr:glycosyltransferase [Acetobacteraceae bacterium KSS8]
MAGSPAGGAELFFERLSIALAADGVEILPLIRRNAGRAERLREGGLAPVELRFGGRLDLFTRPAIRRALATFSPRVAIAWMSRAARMTPEGDHVLAGRLGGFYDLGHYRHCDHLIGNTHGIVRWIREQGWPAERVHYLPNFAAELSGAAPARPASVPAGAKLVLALGRLHRNKAFDVLIRTMPLLPGVHVLIAGEGPEREALQALARSEGVADRLHMPGWAQHTAGLVAACDVLVCPSRHEPLGNVVIEGFSGARPVVAARAQGPVELIHDGEDGVLAALEDPRALAEALASVLDDPVRAAGLAAAGRARFEQEFAVRPVLDRWHDFLQRAEKI